VIEITNNTQNNIDIKPFGYIKHPSIIGRIVLPITRYLRAVNAEKYIKPAKYHLDIGCGDCYFLRRSKCEVRIGVDKLFGDEIADNLDFPDSYFDYVTMLAVIEHLENPQAIMRESARVLKDDGRLIITTPTRHVDRIMKLTFSKNSDEKHENYFDLESLEELSKGLFKIIRYHKFLFGLNQIFCLKKCF